MGELLWLWRYSSEDDGQGDLSSLTSKTQWVKPSWLYGNYTSQWKAWENHPDVCGLRVEKKFAHFRADSTIYWTTGLTDCHWLSLASVPGSVGSGFLGCHRQTAHSGSTTFPEKRTCVLSCFDWEQVLKRCRPTGDKIDKGCVTQYQGCRGGLRGQCSEGPFLSWDLLPTGASGNQYSIQVSSKAIVSGRLHNITLPLSIVVWTRPSISCRESPFTSWTPVRVSLYCFGPIRVLLFHIS